MTPITIGVALILLFGAISYGMRHMEPMHPLERLGWVSGIILFVIFLLTWIVGDVPFNFRVIFGVGVVIVLGLTAVWHRISNRTLVFLKEVTGEVGQRKTLARIGNFLIGLSLSLLGVTLIFVAVASLLVFFGSPFYPEVEIMSMVTFVIGSILLTRTVNLFGKAVRKNAPDVKILTLRTEKDDTSAGTVRRIWVDLHNYGGETAVDCRLQVKLDKSSSKFINMGSIPDIFPDVDATIQFTYITPDTKWIPIDPMGRETEDFIKLGETRTMTLQVVGRNIPVPKSRRAKIVFESWENFRGELVKG